MAQTNYTPISLYYSATASATPSAGNLVAGELAINTNDGKLFYKDSSGVVQTLASKATTSGTFTSITDSGLTSGRVTYATTGGLLTDSANLTFSGSNLSVGGNGSFNVGASGSVSTGNSTYSGYFSAVGGGSGATWSLTPDTISGANGVIYNTSFVSGGSGPHIFSVGGSEKMRLTAAGYLGIGTSSPQAPLNVSYSDSSRNDCLLLTNTNTGGYGPWINFYGNYSSGYSFAKIGAENETTGGTLRFHTADTSKVSQERMRIDSSGNLLVGTTGALSGNTFKASSGAAATFSTTTTSNFSLIYFNNGSYVGSITTNGSVTSYNVTSDQRLKENIVDAPSGNIDDIKVRSFDWIADNSHQTYGMVAQELIKVAPYAVFQPQDSEEMMGVDYSKLVPMMIKEIQDLKQRIATLENK